MSRPPNGKKVGIPTPLEPLSPHAPPNGGHPPVIRPAQLFVPAPRPRFIRPPQVPIVPPAHLRHLLPGEEYYADNGGHPAIRRIPVPQVQPPLAPPVHHGSSSDEDEFFPYSGTSCSTMAKGGYVRKFHHAIHHKRLMRH